MATSFQERMRRRGEQVQTGASRIVRAAALAIDQQLVLGTPVDTGRAREGWIASIDAPANGERVTNNFDRSGQSAIDRANSAISRYRSDKNKRIIISNNVPYIGELNNGSSAQAPSNFIQGAVSTGAAQVRSLKIFDD